MGCFLYPPQGFLEPGSGMGCRSLESCLPGRELLKGLLVVGTGGQLGSRAEALDSRGNASRYPRPNRVSGSSEKAGRGAARGDAEESHGRHWGPRDGESNWALERRSLAAWCCELVGAAESDVGTSEILGVV